MRLFVAAIQAGSLSAAGRELGHSPAVASKRMTRLEAALGTRLLQRSSRRLALTEEGAIYFERCSRILAEVDEAEAAVGAGRHAPQGLLRVSSPVGLGRRWVAPVLAQLASEHPQLSVQLSLSDAMVDLIDGGFDCAVRIGGPEDSRLHARLLAANRRVVCASPAYLAKRGTPTHPSELLTHDCIVLQGDALAPAPWDFFPVNGAERLRVAVRGRFLTDTGELAHEWALAGLGVLRRSIWDLKADLQAGRLVELLPGWTSPSAPIQLVFPSRRHLPARTRLFIERMAQVFEDV